MQINIANNSGFYLARYDTMIKVLIVEDERPIAELIRLSLPRQEYSCTMVYDGIEACDMLKDHRFDLILLDVMLPGADGFEIMDYIRPSGTPVIFITARRDLNDRVRGLELGADDYIVKPFEVIELRARVEAVMRRYGKTRRLIEVGGLRIDTASRQVFRGKEEIRLTKKEFDLMLLFVRNPNVAIYRDTIYEQVWENDYMGDSRTVDLHVQRLRKKLSWQDMIKSVYKVGYRLETGQ